MAITRHCGVVRSTGSRVFVVWRQLPDEPKSCLVIYQDSLPEQYANFVIDLVMGRGQSSLDLWDVMDKVGVLDGRKMLDVLHRLGYLRRIDTSNVDMHIGNGAKIALDLLNEQLEAQTQHTDGKVKEFNPWDDKQTEFQEVGGIVSKLLSEAAQYEQLAKETYERAYSLEPSLRPQAQVQESIETSDLVLTIPEGTSQTKAIELLKKALKERSEK
ncbi:hypothetical protein SEPL_182 [Salmonella phage SE_PL]|uniref:hypothetical protein n=1 Tax=Salmonella enterica TaxID=28901 RepID=UPI000FDF7BCD|nr:hypothetical protein CPT_Munch_245 [Salmonella phage Munch]EAZ2023029.1 hypothetical protein [Salmonella enterica]ECV9084165.1 hypothetical protein [Salmonella enterica subsp. enterica serovar Infantis]MCP0435734.1 hypothetical protein [Salmonella enterica subsp. enterica serovar Mbandaka]QCW18934.1 hypothetical protein 7t3_0413 [Salmonella phage 7t3]QIG62795.1 hypothetical protein SEPL_182 [Salmonella phage SE_PL]WNV47351.1 hypothetical protein [Klebsiella phage fENko-Kae01]